MEQGLQSPKLVHRPPLYERRGSALFDLAKSKSSHRIKRRRQGTVLLGRPLLNSEQTLKSFPEGESVEEEYSLRAISSSSRSYKSADSLETVDENHNHRRRSGYASAIPRDSGVSLAYDNKGYTDSEGKNTVA